ncbi:lysine N(6)-hydroxylase/L-ornithine N(5)-oxygenase family protein [Corynebacterium heidelbergense]|uniref:L-lysine N6-monooxygenase MbtG n=1 Tax=Corynebacterium heidelbergense TaxID=2055947 RepID=A0A364V5Q0_9CORY|nr:SidA/IucD/PvdA family monooxygenase [Corynebacterium heidelbergense]RAV31954.1 L-lysine 6-monooxygenase [Corynebacterium heidelbergense]
MRTTEPLSENPDHAQQAVYDIVGIGIGPFNLGLAALAQPLLDSGELSALFLDREPEFCWHPGMLLPSATIQVPFMADLVTLADPTSRFSFLNYCKLQGRIHRFFIKEDFYPLRREYSDYCAWVARQLPSLRWGSEVTEVRREDSGLWAVTYRDSADQDSSSQTVRARHIVSGVGTQPFVPPALRGKEDEEGVYHSAEYLFHKDRIADAESVTIIGSGQSAAEIYRDLMEHSAAKGHRLDWITRSPRFFPMEYTKLTLEMTSPEYARYFHSLPTDIRDATNRRQRNLYKGISGETINDIYDTYYQLSLDETLPHPFQSTLRTGWSAAWAESGTSAAHTLELTHEESGAQLIQESEVVVLATGYRGPTFPGFLQPAQEQFELDPKGRFAVRLDFSVDKDHTAFVQNAEEHTHSLTAPDLGMGPWRNSVILAAITGREVYPIERHIAFQTFGTVDSFQPPCSSDTPARHEQEGPAC